MAEELDFKTKRLYVIAGAVVLVGCVMILMGWSSSEILAVLAALGIGGTLLKSPISSKEAPEE